MLYCKEIIKHKIGDNTPCEEIAKSLGWTIIIDESNTEIAYDGSLWEKGYAPEKPEAIINAEKVAEAHKFLQETDYCAIKIAEGVATKEDYAEVLAKREEARELIRSLENDGTTISG